MIRLDVLDGNHRRTVRIEGEIARMGRDVACDVQLPGDATVSRVHAVIEVVGAQRWIADAGSRNGTRVNGRLVSERTALRAGDRILVGSFVLVVGAEDESFVETAAADEADATRARLETGLSAREVEVLRLVCAGCSDQQIADELVVSIKTVHSHLDRIRTKSGCRRRPEMIRFAMEHGIA